MLSREYVTYMQNAGGTGPYGWCLDGTVVLVGQEHQVINVLPAYDTSNAPTFTADGILYTENFSLENVGDLNYLDIPIAAPQAVIHYALAYMSRERGDMGAQTVTEWYTMADRYLSDAIAHDANQHPEDLLFRTV
jgi:hypothetical protein